MVVKQKTHTGIVLVVGGRETIGFVIPDKSFGKKW